MKPCHVLAALLAMPIASWASGPPQPAAASRVRLEAELVSVDRVKSELTYTVAGAVDPQTAQLTAEALASASKLKPRSPIIIKGTPLPGNRLLVDEVRFRVTMGRYVLIGFSLSLGGLLVIYLLNILITR
jgi:hypothetical protein